MEIPLKGSTKDTSLVKILVLLNRKRSTGTLSLTTPVFTKKIYLSSGDAIFASSTYEDDRLGEMLLKANKITVEQYDRSVELLKISKKRQGAILVDLGYITPKDLFWGVKYQVREIIYSAFNLADADYEFIEGEIPRQEVITLKMSMGNLIYEGVRKIDNWTRIRNEMPDTESVLRLSSDPLSLFQDVELSPQDRKMLSLIDGKRTIREVIESSWMGSFEALRILYLLWSIGIVEARPHSAGARRPGADAEAGTEAVTLEEILQPLAAEEEETFLKKVESLYSRLGTMGAEDLLEAGKGSDGETIKRNYYRLAKEFHPDRYFNIADESIKTKLTAIFDAITAAYETLNREPRGEDYFGRIEATGTEGADREKQADEKFRAGVSEFKKGNFSGAVENFRAAAERAPESARYWSYLSLSYSRLQGRLREAEEALAAAIRIEPSNADLHANMGLICMRAGRKEKARLSFERALEIDPGNEKARKGLERTGSAQ